MTDQHRIRPLDGAVIGVVIAALILLAFRVVRGNELAEATGSTTTVARAPASTSTSTRSTTVGSWTTTTAVQTSTTSTTPAKTAGPIELAALRIDDGRSASGGYSRDLFPTWLDFDGNGCDARDDTLAAESHIAVTRDGCDVTGGQWVSIYDGVTVTRPSELDVDHMVPLAEAWRSGADSWSAERRARFANDLEYADHLIAVTAATNRSKGDSPPSGWRPPNEDAWCRYATAWVTVKVTWSLTATTRERDALGQMLERC